MQYRRIKKHSAICLLGKSTIIGIADQDGSYVAEFLPGKAYELHGIIRRAFYI